MTNILRDAGLSDLIGPGVEVEAVATGFQFTEGPLWLPDGALLFQDVEAERTYRLAPDGVVGVLREGTGAANGQTFDADGRIVFCEQNGRRVSRMRPDGTGVETLAERFQGKRLNSPNDVVVRSDGAVYFTDPSYGIESDYEGNKGESEFEGGACYVFRVDPITGALEIVADDFDRPN